MPAVVVVVLVVVETVVGETGKMVDLPVEGTAVYTRSSLPRLVTPYIAHP